MVKHRLGSQKMIGRQGVGANTPHPANSPGEKVWRSPQVCCEVLVKGDLSLFLVPMPMVLLVEMPHGYHPIKRLAQYRAVIIRRLPAEDRLELERSLAGNEYPATCTYFLVHLAHLLARGANVSATLEVKVWLRPVPPPGVGNVTIVCWVHRVAHCLSVGSFSRCCTAAGISISRVLCCHCGPFKVRAKRTSHALMQVQVVNDAPAWTGCGWVVKIGRPPFFLAWYIFCHVRSHVDRCTILD